MKDQYIRGLAGHKDIRFIVANTTALVEKARLIHGTSPISTAALGRVLTATVMMGLLMKGNEFVSVQIKGGHRIKNIFATAWSNGYVKGYISDPDVHLPANALGKLDVGGAVGNVGEVVVIRDYGMKEAYVGRSNLVSGEIAEDLAHYYLNSEQQPSAIALGVNLNEDGSVKAAGGLIVQPLPDITDEEIDRLEHAINIMRPMSEMIATRSDCSEILNDVLGGLGWTAFGEGEVHFQCDCNLERIEKALVSIGKKELMKLVEEDKGAEVSCHFCNKKYKLTEQELINLLGSASEKDEEEKDLGK